MVLGRQCDVSLLDSKTSVGNFEVNSALKDYTYVDLSVCIPSHLTANHESSLNMKETELRLGLPGSQSSSRDHLEPDEKPFFPLCPLKDDVAGALFKHVASGNKRGFSQTERTVFPAENWVFPSTLSEIESEKLVSQNVPDPVIKRTGIKESLGDKVTSCGTKAQVIGWPPIRSFRKNTLAKNSKSIEDIKGKTYSDALFVKVSMDGAPYLRKIDLKAYSTYHGLSSTLEKMFSCFIIDQCGSHRSSEQKVIIENNLNNLRYVSKYMLTYEDKDGDWMLVGDVPWEMFIDSCKRLRIMKSTDAIGLEKCKSPS